MPTSSGANAVASTSQKTLDEPRHDELLTEHLGFHPNVFIDSLINSANAHLYSIGAQFEQFVTTSLKSAARKVAKRLKEDPRAKSHRQAHLAKLSSAEIEKLAEQGVHGVLTLLESALDRIFDLLELYCLKTTFGVKAHQARVIVLRHHHGLDLRTAAERTQSGESLTAEEESRELATREIELRRKIEHARHVKHLLRLSQTAANRSRARMHRLTDTFNAVLSTTVDAHGSLALHDSLPQSARKLRVDVESLLDALEALQSTDPLGASLTSLAEAKKKRHQRPSEHERRNVLKASGVSDHETRAWERGREAYVNWEMERILRSIRRQAPDETQHATSDEALRASRISLAPRASVAVASAANKTNESPRSKRRRTTRYSMADPADAEEHQAAQIGDAEAVEELVGRLNG